jgi:hypothetical protein
MAQAVKRDTVTELETFIDDSYRTTVEMAELKQSTKELFVSPLGITSTPIDTRMMDKKRKAQSPLNISVCSELDSDTTLKNYLDKMTDDITSKITISSENLEKIIRSQGSEIENLKSENDTLRMRSQVTEGRLTRVEKMVADLKEDLLRTQQRSMMDNLIFQNLPEVAQENVHNTLMEYMAGKLKISADDISRIHLIKVHRIGEKGRYPRLIVAKINSEGHRIILRHTKNLKGHDSSVYTQLPRELSERRKRLVPAFKDARSKKIATRWNGDKLFVGDKKLEVVPDKVTDINIDTTKQACELKVVRAPPSSLEGSSFQGSKVKVDHPNDVIPAIHAIFTDHRVARATHNIYAYRIKLGERLVEHYEDDGEYGAGRRLLELLRKEDVMNNLICITRWYGGKHLGPARFDMLVDNAKKIINY